MSLAGRGPEPTAGPTAGREDENVEITREAIVTPGLVMVEETITVRQTHMHHAIAALLMDRARAMFSLLVGALFVLTFLVQPFRIPSESMEPTLLVGDFLLVNKALYGPAGHWGWLLPYREPARNDVVVFHFPLDPAEHVVKRVIGMRGDRIHLRDGVVYRNGQPVAEPYRMESVARGGGSDAFRDDFPRAVFTDPGVDGHWWTMLQRSLAGGELVVPAEQFFVLGDNREHSRDSRYWGYVPRRNIVGTPLVIYFSVREPARVDAPALPDDRLGKSAGDRWAEFARWHRILRVVR